MKKYSTKETAVLLGVCPQRVFAKIKQGHFPGAHTCECGRSVLIPEDDILNEQHKKGNFNETRSDAPNRNTKRKHKSS